MQEKQVAYSTSNTYTTLNTFTEKTKNIWLVFHGMGYLSKYFAKYFMHLDAQENFIIIPQAPSKYYLGPKFKHVGSSWLTRENTVQETKNVLSYIDALWQHEKPQTFPRFIVMGYSQGVSIATRWLAARKIQCDELILHSGGIPKELDKKDFEYLSRNCNITYIYGNKDQYITEAKKTEETLKGTKLFGERLTIEVFQGVHEVNTTFLKQIAEN